MVRPVIAAGSNILVTGAGGFVGQAVAQALVSSGYKVRAMMRSDATAVEGAETFIGDITDKESVEQATKGMAAVVHLAARKADEADSEKVNVGGTKLLADACKNHGVSLVINVSTQSAKLRHRGLYGNTKLASEEVLKESGLTVVTLRPSVVYGDEGGGILSSVLAFCQLPVIPMIGAGNVGFMPIHRDDLAAIIVQSLSKGSTDIAYDVGGPDRATLKGFTDEMQRRLGIRKPVFSIPIPVAMLIAILTSWMPRPPVTRSNVLGGAEDVPMDIGPMLRDFGVSPRSFGTGLDTIFVRRNAQVKRQEAAALLRYMLSGSLKYTPSMHDIDTYLEACTAHGADQLLPSSVFQRPLILGGLDAVKRRGSLLDRKLLIAAAVAECSPLTAEATLPKNRSIMAIVLLGVTCVLRSAAKVAIGLPLLLIPSLARHAR